MTRKGCADAVIGYVFYVAAGLFALWTLSSFFPDLIKDRNNAKGLGRSVTPIFAAIGLIAILILKLVWKKLKAWVIRNLRSRS